MIIRAVYHWAKRNNFVEEIAAGLGAAGFGLAVGLGLAVSLGLAAGFGLAVSLAAGFGLAVGIGLAVSLVAGLVFGIVGIATGVFASLGTGIFAGLIASIASSLTAGLVAGLFNNQYGLEIPIWLFFLIVLAIAEILFIISSRKEKKKKITLWYILGRKLEEIFDVLLVAITILNIRWVVQHVDFSKYWPEILKWIGYIGIIFIVIALIWLWLHLNKMIMERKK